MKKIILLCLFVAIGATGFSQEGRYEQTMSRYLAEMDSAFAGVGQLVELANKFERVGKAEKDKWLPFYYSAFLQVMAAFTGKDASQMDAYADRAESLINVADSLEKENSEISCVRSLIASCRLVADPMSRYMTFGPLAETHLKDAMAQDPQNPRPYMLNGQNIMHTPVQFGGGCDKAHAILQTAMEKYADFKPATPLHPDWGEDQVKKMLEDCNK